MSYLGTKPANQITDSTLIADGTITTSDLASGLTVNFADGSASTPSITNDGDTNTGIFFPAADTIAFAEGGAEVMRIDSDGDVGIGTTNPRSKFTVAGTLRRNVVTNGTNASPSEEAGLIYEDAGVSTERTGIYFSNTFLSAGNTEIRFKTILNDVLAERMRIDSSGNLLVGTTVTPSGSVGGAGFIRESAGRSTLYCAVTSTGTAGLINFYNPNGNVGYIATSGSATQYVTSSDYRLKENIAPMTGALAVVGQLKPCTYTWKADGSSGQGFIAHELQAVVPDAVVGEKDAVDAEGKPVYQGIDTSFLVATLTAAIQEQQAIITEQASAITALEARLTALETK